MTSLPLPAALQGGRKGPGAACGRGAGHAGAAGLRAGNLPLPVPPRRAHVPRGSWSLQARRLVQDLNSVLLSRTCASRCKGPALARSMTESLHGTCDLLCNPNRPKALQGNPGVSVQQADALMRKSAAALHGTDNKCATSAARRPQRYGAAVPAASTNGLQPETKAALPAVVRARQRASAPKKLRGAAAASSGGGDGLPNGSAADRIAPSGGGAPGCSGAADGGTAYAADELGAIPGISQTGMGFGGGRFR
jgi:hypothetical protein